MLETVVRRCHHKPLRWGIQGDNEEATRIPQVIYPRLINEIFTALAPYHQNSGRETVHQFNEGMAPRFTGEKLREICGRIHDNKAPYCPGYDDIPEDQEHVMLINTQC